MNLKHLCETKPPIYSICQRPRHSSARVAFVKELRNPRVDSLVDLFHVREQTGVKKPTVSAVIILVICALPFPVSSADL